MEVTNWYRVLQEPNVYLKKRIFFFPMAPLIKFAQENVKKDK